MNNQYLTANNSYARVFSALLPENHQQADISRLRSLCKEIEALTSLLNCDMLDSSHADEYRQMIFSKKEQYVLSVQRTKIQEQKGKRKNGKEYIIFAARPNGESKYLKSANYEGLIDKLFSHYTGLNDSATLRSVFKDATLWKSQRNISGKTVVEYKRIWDKYYDRHAIVDIPLEKVDVFILTDFYEELCVKYHLTWKQLQNVRSVMSYIMSYCIKQRLIRHNPTTDVNYQDLPYARTGGRNDKIKKTPFPSYMLPDIISWCYKALEKPKTNPLHPLGIIIGVELGDRYGELKGLRWSNINFPERTITVDDQSVPMYSVNDDLSFSYEGHQLAGHIKGYEEPVPLPIPDEAYDALLRIRELGLDDEFVFPENHFRHGTFNNYIKKMAEELGLDPSKYSSHCLRATAATNLYLRTHDIFLVQRLLHHTTPEMTMKYVKDLNIAEKLRETMGKSLIEGSADQCGPKIISFPTKEKSPESLIN